MLDQVRASTRFTLPARSLWALVLGALALTLGAWLSLTPPGALGKADAVGYAICHRIDLRSFHLGDRALPLCARCTGIYLGALFGVITLAALGHGRTGDLPTRPMLVILVGFIAAMGVDGANSYLTLFPGLPHLYEPNNQLRMITGTLNGLAIATLIFPVFNQTLWKNWAGRPIVARPRELAALIAVGAALILLVFTEAPVVLYPLALLSALGVLALIAMLHTVIWLLATGTQNRAAGWRSAALPILAGFTTALIQIALIDAARYAVFGTWDGFSLPG